MTNAGIPSSTVAHLSNVADVVLLEQFITQKDHAAFEALVRRYGPLVFGVCLRTLENQHDAEDAFQSTFLIFARKAASIARRGTPANWLYHVARRTALKVQAANSRRQCKEKPMAEFAEPVAPEPAKWQDLAPIIDRELSSLPSKYQSAVILCDIQGNTHRNAALQLGWPEGTLVTRLRKARQILAGRLARQGITLSISALAWLLSQNAACANIPERLVAATTQTALLLVMVPRLSDGANSFRLTPRASQNAGPAVFGLSHVTIAAIAITVPFLAAIALRELHSAADAIPRDVRRHLLANVRGLSPISISWLREAAPSNSLTNEEVLAQLKLPKESLAMFAPARGEFLHLNPWSRERIEEVHVDTDSSRESSPGGFSKHVFDHAYDGARIYNGHPNSTHGSAPRLPFLMIAYPGQEQARGWRPFWFPWPVDAGFALPQVDDHKLPLDTALLTRHSDHSLVLLLAERAHSVVFTPATSDAPTAMVKIANTDRQDVFCLAPEFGYAVVSHHSRDAEGRLLATAEASDFTPVLDSSLWLPRQIRKTWFSFVTNPGFVSESPLFTELFTLERIERGTFDHSDFMISYNHPGSAVLDHTLLPETQVAYTIPEDAGRLALVIEEATRLALHTSAVDVQRSGAQSR